MITTPITLYSANLIESSSQITISSNEAQITFSSLTKIDAILIKNSAIISIQVDYKTSAEQDSWSQGPLLTQSQKEDKIFILTSSITAKMFRLTFNITADTNDISLVQKLLSLENILSTYTLDNIFKGNSYYLANGSLVCWQEYTKKKLNLNLSNLSQSLLNNLKTTLKNNTFLTYVLFGDFDGYFAAEFALKESPSFYLNRQSGLYSTSLILLER